MKRQLENLIFSMYLKKHENDELRRFGSEYGGWHICLCKKHLSIESIVVSGGVGEDISFDVELLRFAEKVSIKLVDPTPKAISHYESYKSTSDNLDPTPYSTNGRQEPAGYFSTASTRSRISLIRKAISVDTKGVFLFPPKNSQHSSYSSTSIGDSDNKVEFQSSSLFEIFGDINKENGSKLANLIILKLDIEGSEFAVLMQNKFTNPKPSQIAVEIDFMRELNRGYFAKLSNLVLLLKKMKDSGYRLANKEKSNLLFLAEM
jgi:hypothetical protein